MPLLAVLVGLFSAAAAAVSLKTGDNIVLLLAGVGFLCAFTTYRSRTISTFLQIFAAIFAAETVIFGTVFLIAQTGLWPSSLEEYELPESLPLTVAIFGILVHAISFIPVVRSMTRIADRYFDTSAETRARIWPFPAFGARERRVAIAMVVLLVVINQAQVGMNLRLSFFNRDWFNAIQNKDEAAFWSQLFTVFTPWAFLFIATAVLEYVVTSTLIIRWRRWLTSHYVNRWLDAHTHYRMSLAGGAADNPDQRISEDINRFIDGGQIGYGIYSFSILLISNLSSLVSFAILLWDLSANFTLPYTAIAVPGFLFWVALIYAGVGTLVTHLIGRPLVRLSFERQRYEADFRFSLARLREYAEQVALLSGEPTEKISLTARFGAIVKNYFQIIACRKNLTAFTASYGQLSPIIPFVVAAPFYFAGKITLGIMTQTARAFGSVDEALTFFVTYYVSLAEFKAVLDRLTSFDLAIENAKTPGFRAKSERGHRAEKSRHRGAEFAASGRPRDRRRRESAVRRQRAGGSDRPFRFRQIDFFPGDLRHLALCRRRDHLAGGGKNFAAAAKALYSDRDVTRRRDLSGKPRSLRRRGDTRCAACRATRRSHRRTRCRGQLAAAAFRRRAAAPCDCPRDIGQARLALPRRSHVGDGRSDGSRNLRNPCRKTSRHDDRFDWAPRESRAVPQAPYRNAAF